MAIKSRWLKINFLCRFGLHDWAKWSKPYLLTEEVPQEWRPNRKPVLKFAKQNRTCDECGVIHERYLK